MSLSPYTADVFADKTAWTYNPDKAIRLYAEYSGIVGDVDGESKKIARVFQRDMDFDFDLEYYFHQKYSEMMNDLEYTKILLSDKTFCSVEKLGLIPFAGVSPFSLFCCRQTKHK